MGKPPGKGRREKPPGDDAAKRPSGKPDRRYHQSKIRKRAREGDGEIEIERERERKKAGWRQGPRKEHTGETARARAAPKQGEEEPLHEGAAVRNTDGK